MKSRRTAKHAARFFPGTRRARTTVGDLVAIACDVVGPGPDLGLRVSQLLSQGPLADAVTPRLSFGRR